MFDPIVSVPWICVTITVYNELKVRNTCFTSFAYLVAWLATMHMCR